MAKHQTQEDKWGSYQIIGKDGRPKSVAVLSLEEARNELCEAQDLIETFMKFNRLARQAAINQKYDIE